MKTNQETTTPRFSVVRFFLALIRWLLRLDAKSTSSKGGTEININQEAESISLEGEANVEEETRSRGRMNTMVLGSEDSLHDLLDAAEDPKKAKEAIIAENSSRLEARRVSVENRKKENRKRFTPTLPSVREDSQWSELASNVMQAEQRASARVENLGDRGKGHSPESEPGITLRQ